MGNQENSQSEPEKAQPNDSQTEEKIIQSQKSDKNQLKNSQTTSKSSQKSSQKSDSSDSLILSQHLSQLSKDKYENEVTETLEMTQIIDWDDENFFEASNDEEDKAKID